GLGINLGGRCRYGGPYGLHGFSGGPAVDAVPRMDDGEAGHDQGAPVFQGLGFGTYIEGLHGAAHLGGGMGKPQLGAEEQAQRHHGGQEEAFQSFHRPASSPWGTVNQTVVPCPSTDSMPICPPWAAIISRAMASPRPVPPKVRARALSTR